MGTNPQALVPVLLSLVSLLPSISVTRKVRMCFSSLTTFSVSLKPVRKYLPFSVVFHPLSVTNPPWPLTWVPCRNVLPPPKRVPSHLCRLSTYLLTICPILPLPQLSPIWTPPLCCLVVSLNWVSTLLSILWIPPPVCWTPTLSERTTTTLPVVCKNPARLQITPGYYRHFGYGRVVRRRQAHRRPCPQDPTFPLAALPSR